MSSSSSQFGYTFPELLLAAFVLVTVVLGIVGLAVLNTRTAVQSERRTVALGLANEQIEYIRTLPYDSVGLTDPCTGICDYPEPDGTLQRESLVSRNDQPYTLHQAVELIDDPENGTVSGTLNETNADYKKVRITVSWTDQQGQTQEIPVVVTYVVQGAIPLRCVPGTQCPDGQICPSNGVCPEPIVCDTNNPCPSGLVCPSSGFCASPSPSDTTPPGGCTPGVICPNGVVCPPNGICPPDPWPITCGDRVLVCQAGQCCDSGGAHGGGCQDIGPPPWIDASGQCLECLSSADCPVCDKCENYQCVRGCRQDEADHHCCPKDDAHEGLACTPGGCEVNNFGQETRNCEDGSGCCPEGTDFIDCQGPGVDNNGNGLIDEESEKECVEPGTNCKSCPGGQTWDECDAGHAGLECCPI